MLLSMTGFGDARRQDDGRRAVAVEVRTVNNRFLKCSVRMPDALGAFEGEVEKLVRATVARGTVNVTVRVERLAEAGRYRLDDAAVAAYVAQARAVAEAVGLPLSGLDPFLTLPGVVTEREQRTDDAAELWPAVAAALSEALAKLDDFRRTEGAAMADDLLANLATIEAEVGEIAALAPEIVREHRDKLLARVSELLAGTDGQVVEADLIREVSLFADKADVNEEIARLRSHIAQFRAFVDDPQSQGRKLDFLTQELFREVNTIGSKANSVAIAHRAVEMKAAVEKVRENLQNIE